MSLNLSQKYIAVVAAGANNEIGKDKALLWHLPKDMKWFKEQTMGGDVIMGRTSYEAIPPAYRPLKGRTNIVVTRNSEYEVPEGVKLVHSLGEAFDFTEKCTETGKYIIGGGQIYKQAMPFTCEILLTRVHASFPDADTYFPDLDGSVWKEVWREDHPADDKHLYDFSFIRLVRH